MCAELFNEKGESVTGYTPEEVEEMLVKEREDAATKASELREEEINNLMTEKEVLAKEKTDLEARIAGLDNKDKSFKTLNTALDNKQKKIEELEGKVGQLGTEMNQRLSEMSKKIVGDLKEELLAAYVGDDKDLRDKVEHFYGQFVGDPITKAEMKERIENAYTLATGGKGRVSLTGDAVSGAFGSRYVPKPAPSETKLSGTSAIEVAKKLGLNDAQIKKYGL